jgi:hypothetical protein
MAQRQRQQPPRGNRPAAGRATKTPTEQRIVGYWFVPIFSNSCFFFFGDLIFSDSSHRLQEEQSLTIYAAFSAGDQALNHHL